MRQNDLTPDKINHYIALAERYDQTGQYVLADKIYAFLSNFLEALPMEVRLRVTQKNPKYNQQSMSSAEAGQGFVYLKGGDYKYMSGKGQAAYRDRIPLTMDFNNDTG